MRTMMLGRKVSTALLGIVISTTFLATGNAATAHAAGPPWADPEQTAELIDAQEHIKNKQMWDRISDAFCDLKHVTFTDAQILNYFDIARISPVRYRRDTV